MPNKIVRMIAFSYLSIAVTLFILFVSLNGIINATPSQYVTFPNDSKLHNLTYPEWAAKWWKWWVAIPSEKHPGEKFPDIQRCSVLQDGPVWFLPDVLPGLGKVNYECSVPFGKDILLPISTTECESGGVEGYLSDKELRDCAFNILTPHDRIELLLDGTRINVTELGAPIRTDFFNVTYPESPLKIWGGGIQPGTYRAISEGYFALLRELPPGNHTLEFKVVDLLKGNEGPPPKFDPPREGKFDISVQ